MPAKVGRNDQLEQVDAMLDWEPVAAVVRDIYAAPEGRPSYPPVVLVKVLVLQQWDNASDPEIEAALWDRLSFRGFVGLGLGERVFTEVTRQLDAAGWLVKAGTLLDATLVAAQARRPSITDGPGAGSTTDPDASWTRKGGRAHFGYQAHLGVDAESGLIRRAVLTPAHVNEREVADTLISSDERAVYADKAYESTARRARLRAQGINDRIMHRSHKHQAGLPYWQQRRNALIGLRRAPVEHVFGTLKRSLRVPDGALLEPGAQRGGVVVQVPGLQPAARVPAAGAGPGLTRDPCAARATETRGNAWGTSNQRPRRPPLAAVWR